MSVFKRREPMSDPSSADASTVSSSSAAPATALGPANHPLAGASVLLVGATGGLGQALHAELKHRGAIVTVVGRTEAKVQALDPERGVSLDLRTAEACQQAVAAGVVPTGSIDVVINAVGVVAFGAVADLSIDAMEELFLTNTFIPIMLAKAALPHINAGGAIVNISGVIAEQNMPGMGAYGASKAAVRSFDEALAREARRSKIRVLDARPGHTETGLADRPIEGAAPKFPDGLSPASVAATICDALESGSKDLPSTAF